MNPNALITFLFLLFFVASYATAQDKLALIVAISNYQSGTGWDQLHSGNDVPLIEYALQQQGFEQKNILALKDAEATKEGIINAIKTHLYQRAESGGRVVFHFSGHGQQVQDDNGDELDGLDEAIVPFDSPMNYQRGVYEGQQLIRDEELGALLNQIRERLGSSGSVVVVLDACHSGTGIRGNAAARGTDVIMAAPSYLATLKNIIDINTIEGKHTAANEELAPIVAFFSSGANQLNYEMRTEEGLQVGPLSYAFSKAFAQAERSTSYRAVFDRIQLEMVAHVPRQRPQAEGDLDLLVTVAGGRLEKMQPHFLVDADRWISPNQIPLKGGSLMGLLPGTKVVFLPINTTASERVAPKASGVVIKSGSIYAIVELDQPLSKKEALNSWVFIKEYGFGEINIKLKINFHSENFKDAFLKGVTKFPVIQIVNEHPDLILQSQPSGEIELRTADNYLVFSLFDNNSSEETTEDLIKAILSFTQGKFLRTLEVQHPQIQLKLSLISVSNNTNTSATQGTVFSVGNEFKIKITNEGKVGAYYSLLDIQSDNQINVAIPIPSSTYKPEDYFIRPGETHEISESFEVFPPTGTEVLKLIGSTEPLHLSNLLTQDRAEIENLQNSLEKLLAATNFYYNRGESNQLSLTPEASISSVVFSIIE